MFVNNITIDIVVFHIIAERILNAMHVQRFSMKVCCCQGFCVIQRGLTKYAIENIIYITYHTKYTIQNTIYIQHAIQIIVYIIYHTKYNIYNMPYTCIQYIVFIKYTAWLEKP